MNSSNRFGLTTKTLQALASVFSKYLKIEKITIYGSRAIGNYKEGSDIDIVLTAPLLTTNDLLKIENELEELMLPYKIDLSLYHQIENPELVEHIKRVGIILG